MHTAPIALEHAPCPAPSRLPRALASIVFVPLVVAAVATAAIGAVMAARGGTMTVMHMTDGSGTVFVEAARYVGTAGVVRGVLEAVGVAIAAVAIFGRGVRRRVAGLALIAYLGWYGWNALVFVQHASSESWPWTTLVAVMLGLIATAWLAFGPLPQRREEAGATASRFGAN